MTRFLLRVCYGFEMTEAYLAECMGDTQCERNHKAKAKSIAAIIELIDLNKERGGLFANT